MGTNYYLRPSGREAWCTSLGLHIGKSSAGWRGYLHGDPYLAEFLPEVGRIVSRAQWRAVFRTLDTMGGWEIRDEYGSPIPFDRIMIDGPSLGGPSIAWFRNPPPGHPLRHSFYEVVDPDSFIPTSYDRHWWVDAGGAYVSDGEWC